MKVDVENILVNILFFLVLFVGCKKKDEVPEQTTLSDKYTLEIDSTFRIYQVSFSSSDSRRNFIIAYNYSPKTIRETVTYSGEPGVRVSTFHINNSGLTDSCQFSYYYNSTATSSSTSYFVYDSNNYLKMKIYKMTDSYSDQTPDTTFYDYDNGNMIKYTYSGGIFGVSFPTSSIYTYNSIKNFIDIESFNGAFLGKLNQNLIESATDYGSPEGIYLKKYSSLLLQEFISALDIIMSILFPLILK